MRRSGGSGGGGSGSGGGSNNGSLTGKGRICVSIVVVLMVVSFVVTIPPMKAKQYLATTNGDVSEVQRIISAHQRQQVLDDDEIGALNRPDQMISEDKLSEDLSQQQQPGGGDSFATNSKDSSKRSFSSMRRKIDLTLYIVFHKTLFRENYEGVRWADIAFPAPLDSSSNPTTLDTASVVSALTSPGGANRTTILFVATNKKVKKRFPADLVRGRMINEWELPGHDTRIGSVMNEYGAMNSIFSSQLTQHAGNIANVAGRGSNPRLIAADADGDGVQEWIGVFQYDMRIDQKLLQLIRRRIRSRTQAAVTSLATTNSRGELVARAPSSKAALVSGTNGGHFRLHCCIFYGVSYPTRYLLHNPLGKLLVEEYNSFFGGSFTLDDMPPVAILDAFVVPTIVFNHFAPFLESVMLRVIRNPLYFPQKPGRHPIPVSSSTGVGGSSIVSVVSPATTRSLNKNTNTNNNAESGNSGAQNQQQQQQQSSGNAIQKALVEHGLDVMEAALAVALGLETLFVQVQLPLRHKSWEGTS
ncbi:membrane-associated protein, putative [Bodo saltans]|uniref:Membrane-associated protein, putative n=1 Tax=Bodo saltans TaxID=75058 RepID=A0A0S4KG88_BODSA|nr:membrane-associated protein, putative [Bodo saltans]|eukprot:CUI14706.1 membrane-associated protein, putative [Bodo saltans]